VSEVTRLERSEKCSAMAACKLDWLDKEEPQELRETPEFDLQK